MRTGPTLLGIGIAVVQLIDIVIHAVTNQLEPVRVTSNLIVLFWLAAVATGAVRAKFLQSAIVSIGAYLALNGLFLSSEGVTNPESGGELRVPLFTLVFLTAGLSFLLTALDGKRMAGQQSRRA